MKDPYKYSFSSCAAMQPSVDIFIEYLEYNNNYYFGFIIIFIYLFKTTNSLKKTGTILRESVKMFIL